MDPYISQKLVASKQSEMLAESHRERLAHLRSIRDVPMETRGSEATRTLALLGRLLTPLGHFVGRGL